MYETNQVDLKCFRIKIILTIKSITFKHPNRYIQWAAIYRDKGNSSSNKTSLQNSFKLMTQVAIQNLTQLIASLTTNFHKYLFFESTIRLMYSCFFATNIRIWLTLLIWLHISRSKMTTPLIHMKNSSLDWSLLVRDFTARILL